MRKLIVCLSALLLLTGCPKTGPQTPSYRSGRQEVRPDSALLQAVETNRHLAEEADRALTVYADSGFAQQELGYWSRGMVLADSVLPADSAVTIRRVVYAMDSTLLEDVTETVTPGQPDQVQAVADALQQMEHGQSVTLLVPWYLGYGATGSAVVPPYTNVRIELTVE